MIVRTSENINADPDWTDPGLDLDGSPVVGWWSMSGVGIGSDAVLVVITFVDVNGDEIAGTCNLRAIAELPAGAVGTKVRPKILSLGSTTGHSSAAAWVVPVGNTIGKAAIQVTNITAEGADHFILAVFPWPTT